MLFVQAVEALNKGNSVVTFAEGKQINESVSREISFLEFFFLVSRNLTLKVNK